MEKLWQIVVHLHRKCYGNSENWQKHLANFCNSPNSPKFFTVIVFTVRYCIYDQPKLTNHIVILMFNAQ